MSNNNQPSHPKITPKVKTRAIKLAAVSRAEARKYLEAQIGVKKTQANQWLNRILFANPEKPSFDDEPAVDSLEFSEKYVYNATDGKYIFFCQKVGKNIVLDKQTVDNLLLSYSNYDSDPSSINEISRKFNIPRAVVKEVLSILCFTHDEIPVTQESLLENSEETIVDDLIQQKRFTLLQKLQKKDWEATKQDAVRWNEFQAGVINPVESFLSSWNPPKHQPIPKCKMRDGKNVFVCVLQDTHIGEFTDKETVFSGKEYSSLISLKNIRKYITEVKARLETRTLGWKEGVIVLNGDIMNSCLDEYTRRNTKLHCDAVNEVAFNLALDIITEFVTQFSALFKKTKVLVQAGNHDSVVCRYLGTAAKQYFRTDKSIEFEIFRSWLAPYRFNNVYAIITHGSSDTMKAALPSGPKLKSFVQEMLIQNPKMLAECKQRIVLAGHLHSQLIENLGSFQLYRFGTTVSADGYGEALGHYTSPQQSCLVIGEDSVDEVWNFDL